MSSSLTHDDDDFLESVEKLIQADVIRLCANIGSFSSSSVLSGSSIDMVDECKKRSIELDIDKEGLNSSKESPECVKNQDGGICAIAPNETDMHENEGFEAIRNVSSLGDSGMGTKAVSTLTANVSSICTTSPVCPLAPKLLPPIKRKFEVTELTIIHSASSDQTEKTNDEFDHHDSDDVFKSKKQEEQLLYAESDENSVKRCKSDSDCQRKANEGSENDDSVQKSDKEL